MYLVCMAFKNLWRNKRRTIINLVAFTVNIALIIFFAGVYRFRIEDSYSKTTRYLTGHIQIHHSAYEKEEAKLPLRYPVPCSEDILAKLQTLEGVVFAGRRIEFGLYISNGTDKLYCSGIAFEPEEEAKFTMLAKSVTAGRYLESGDSGVLMGSQMASLFGFHVGDVIRMITRTKYNTPNLIDAEIIGIFDTGFTELDKSAIYVPYRFAEELLMMENEPTELIVGLENRRIIQAIMHKIKTLLREREYTHVKVREWTFFAKALISDVEQDTRFLTIFLFILVLIAVFGMSNSMSMNVMERTRELGTMRAIGLNQWQMVRLINCESILVSLLGVLLGCVAGGLICLYISKVGIPINAGDITNIHISKRFYVISRPFEYMISILIGITAGIGGGLFPALRTKRLKIVEALRQV